MQGNPNLEEGSPWPVPGLDPGRGDPNPGDSSTMISGWSVICLKPVRRL